MLLKKYPLRLFTALPFLLGIFFTKKEDQPTQDDDGWVGTIYYNYKMFNVGDRDEMGVKSEWAFYRKADIIITVKGIKKERKKEDEHKEKNIGLAYMTDNLDKREQITSPYIKEMKAIQITTEKEKGKGEDSVNVWVEIDRERATYTIKTNGPMYDVERRSRIWSNIIEMAGGVQPEDTSFRANDGIAIDVPEQTMLTRDPKHLSGTYVVSNSGYVHITVTWSLRKKCPPWNNPLTQKNLNTLDPKVKAAAARFIQRVNDELCIRLKIASAYRTKEEQDVIYAMGRDANGKKIGKTFTNARGGQSNHNFAKAIDVYYATDTGIDKDKVLTADIVEIARQEGFSWGGYWEDPDYPHFEMNP